MASMKTFAYNDAPVWFDGVRDYLKSSPFILPGVSGNYASAPDADKQTISGDFTYTSRLLIPTMKKPKVKKPTICSLQKQLKQVSHMNELRLDGILTRDKRIYDLERQVKEANDTLNNLRKQSEHQLKSIGLYFAALDSETSNTEDAVKYLRALRAEIFGAYYSCQGLR